MPPRWPPVRGGLGLSVLLIALALPACSAGDRVHVPETGVQKIAVNGQKLAYFEQGEGPLVLLMHGFPDTPHSWDAVRPALAAAGFRAVTPFMRGYAPSSIPLGAENYASPVLGQDVLGLVRALGDGAPAFVVGHDWGASAAYAAAILGPEDVRALVTVAIPHPGFIRPDLGFLWKARHFLYLSSPAGEWIMRRDDFAHVESLYRRWSPRNELPSSEFEPAKNAFALPASLTGAVEYYRALKLSGDDFFRARIRVPTLAFAGESDGVASPDVFDAAREGFEGEYTVERLPGGHFLHRENSDAFTEKLLDFLRRH